MNELELITSESTVDSLELKVLIARLASPNYEAPEGSVRVQDIAETLDLEQSKVIATLAKMRNENGKQAASQSSETHLTVAKNRTHRLALGFIVGILAVVFYGWLRTTVIVPDQERRGKSVDRPFVNPP